MKYSIGRVVCSVLICAFVSWSGEAQETKVYSQAERPYLYGLERYDLGLFGASEQFFKEAAELNFPIPHPKSRQLRLISELMAGQSAVRHNRRSGEKNIRSFIDKHRPDPLTAKAIFELGNYYYTERNYERAIHFYEQLETKNMTIRRRSEVHFKQGYCHFVRKEFSEATASFAPIRQIKNEYYYPVNYYYGMAQYFQNNYDQAINALRNAGHSRKYEHYVPYYITAIQFAKGNYEEVINYAPPLLEEGTLRNENEIHLLLAQAYFEGEQFDKALPHFEVHREHAQSMRPEDIYMMGYTAYQTGEYEQAIEQFKTVSGQDKALAQQANFYLADCYLKLDNRESARNAFANAARFSDNAELQSEASFQYAKLSTELGYDREAVRVLQKFEPDSEYYLRGQRILKDIFLNTKDYARAIDIIEQLPQKTPDIKEAYQKVTYYRALQLLTDDELNDALIYLDKSLDVPIDQKFRAMAMYWKGDIEHRKEQFQKSIGSLNKYFTLAKKHLSLPDETSIHVANYLQGYNHLKQEDYTLALGNFRDASEGLQLDDVNLSEEFIEKKILADAMVRTGDCYFKRNQYDNALDYYTRAIELNEVGFVYALYQKALIQGLQENRYEKILTLEDLVQEYPQSNYADNALLEMGDTYMGLNQMEEASKPLQKLVSNYSNTSSLLTQALLKLGLISYNLGDVEQSLSFYKRVFEHNPTAEEVRGSLRAIEEIYVNDLGEPGQYVAFVEENAGMNLDELSRDSLTYRSAYVQYEQAKYERSIEEFSDYLEQFPDGIQSIAANYYRGESYLSLEKYGEALEDYDRVVQQGPGSFYADALRKAAIISYNHAEDFDSALSYYSELYESAESEEVIHEAALGGLRSANRLDQWTAIKKWSTVILGSEQSTTEEQNKAHFYLGKLAYREERTDDALEHLNEVVRNSNNELTAESRYLISKMYYEQEEYKTAQKLSRQAVQESSSYPRWVARTLLLLADIYIAQDNLFDAKAAVEAIIENFNSDEEILQKAKVKLEQVEQLESKDSKVREDKNDSLLELRENENQ